MGRASTWKESPSWPPPPGGRPASAVPGSERASGVRVRVRGAPVSAAAGPGSVGCSGRDARGPWSPERGVGVLGGEGRARLASSAANPRATRGPGTGAGAKRAPGAHHSSPASLGRARAQPRERPRAGPAAGPGARGPGAHSWRGRVGAAWDRVGALCLASWVRDPSSGVQAGAQASDAGRRGASAGLERGVRIASGARA